MVAPVANVNVAVVPVMETKGAFPVLPNPTSPRTNAAAATFVGDDQQILDEVPPAIVQLYVNVPATVVTAAHPLTASTTVPFLVSEVV